MFLAGKGSGLEKLVGRFFSEFALSEEYALWFVIGFGVLLFAGLVWVVAVFGRRSNTGKPDSSNKKSGSSSE